MDLPLEDKIRQILNEALIRKLLSRYFQENKDIPVEKFNKPIHPAILQDLPQAVSQLQGKIEIRPYVEDINVDNGKVDIGWNLFALGTQRLFLGKSTHRNLSELEESVNGVDPKFKSKKLASPKRIIEFILTTLGDSESGIIDPAPNDSKNGFMSDTSSISPSGGNQQFYGGSQGFERNRSV